MRSILSISGLLGLLVTFPAGCALSPPSDGSPPRVVPPERTFAITYEASLVDLPVGESLELWIPVPHDDAHQRIRNLEVSGPWEGKFHTEPVYRNRMVHFSGVVRQPEMSFVIEYEVDRWPYKVDLASFQTDGPPDGAEYDRYRQPSTLGFVTPQVEREAKDLSSGRTSTLERTRAFYDHVLGNMAYDKNHQGWGRGSIEHACAVGKGNCTDFHTYFNSLCLAAGVTARFQIGIYGSYEVRPDEYTTGGYHCWSEFRVPGRGWVPVDISEADRNPDRAEDFFGGHTSNRVTLSTGRDLILAPAQEGPPLNYFLYPYAEVNGEPLTSEQVRKTTRWRDLLGS